MSSPIPIESHNNQHRHHSTSASDEFDSTSPSSVSSTSLNTPLQTPLSGYQQPRIGGNHSPPTSPTTQFLSYFMPSSPVKPVTFPFRKGSGAPDTVLEDDEVAPPRGAVSAHARRASIAYSGRFVPQQPQQQQPAPSAGPPQEGHQDRGTGLLRRLSLGNALVRPPIPSYQNPRSTSPPTAPAQSAQAQSPVTATSAVPAPTRGRKLRANTLGPGQPPKRAPSPMGERMLKGHFDGFN